jgi:hypothetical protein
VIIVAFCLTDEVVTPDMIVVDDRNRFVRRLDGVAMSEGVTGGVLN